MEILIAWLAAWLVSVFPGDGYTPHVIVTRVNSNFARVCVEIDRAEPNPASALAINTESDFICGNVFGNVQVDESSPEMEHFVSFTVCATVRCDGNAMPQGNETANRLQRASVDKLYEFGCTAYTNYEEEKPDWACPVAVWHRLDLATPSTSEIGRWTCEIGDNTCWADWWYPAKKLHIMRGELAWCSDHQFYHHAGTQCAASWWDFYTNPQRIVWPEPITSAPTVFRILLPMTGR